VVYYLSTVLLFLSMDTQKPKAPKAGIIIAIIAVILIIAFVIWKMQSGPTSVPTNQTSNDTGDLGATTTPITDNKKYKDGTYTAVGNYRSPAGSEQVDITITLVNGRVSDATFAGEGVNPTTKRLQGMFAAGFKEFVVGKPIDSISLTVVNGSSLTPKGFMDALQKIKIEATATV
jgi:uncharacterized protein with FMN-binding domain